MSAEKFGVNCKTRRPQIICRTIYLYSRWCSNGCSGDKRTDKERGRERERVTGFTILCGIGGLWPHWCQQDRQSSNTNMRANNLKQHPESINGDRASYGSVTSSSSPNNCWSCNDFTSDSNGPTMGADTQQQQNRQDGTTTYRRMRIGNIAATYLFIGLLLLLQSGYLCHGTYLLPQHHTLPVLNHPIVIWPHSTTTHSNNANHHPP